MEGGIEAGDLRQVGKLLGERADGGEVVRLVQRRQRLELPQLARCTCCVQPHRPGVEQAAVDHPVAGGDDVDVGLVALQPVDQEAHRRPHGRASSAGQSLLADHLAVLVLADEVRPRCRALRSVPCRAAAARRASSCGRRRT